MAKIFISIPILEKPELRSLHSVYMAVMTSKHQCRLYFNENDSLISRVRNVHASLFLDEFPDYDYFCSIDSDIEIKNVFKNNNALDKLIDHNVDFCGGLYALKKQNEVKCSSIPMEWGNIKYNSGLLEMRWLSTGCWMLKRSVMEKMRDAYPELHYRGDDNVAGKDLYALYMPMIYEMTEQDIIKDTAILPWKKYLSEDWAFSARWKKLGGKIYADTSIYLKHIGRKDYVLWDLEAENVEDK